MPKRTFTLTERILHLLLMKSEFLTDYGLLSGQMGIILAVTAYNREARTEVYEDFADDLFDTILKKLHNDFPVGFEKGLCGIGWGVEYLIGHGFVEGCGVEVCEALDRKIMEKDPRRISDLSLETGLEGLLNYVLAHLYGAVRQQSALPFDREYLDNLFSAVEKACRQPATPSLRTLSDVYRRFMAGETGWSYPMSLKPFLAPVEIDEKRLCDYPLGIKEGLAGILLNQQIDRLP